MTTNGNLSLGQRYCRNQRHAVPTNLIPVVAFTTPKICRTHQNKCLCRQYSSMNEEEDEEEGAEDDLWSSLAVRVARMRLEEENTRRFLKSGATFLTYEKCKEWIQQNGYGWKSKEEWDDYISLGENVQWFISSDPEGYYKNSGWISWTDFLGGIVF